MCCNIAAPTAFVLRHAKVFFPFFLIRLILTSFIPSSSFIFLSFPAVVFFQLSSCLCLDPPPSLILSFLLLLSLPTSYRVENRDSPGYTYGPGVERCRFGLSNPTKPQARRGQATIKNKISRAELCTYVRTSFCKPTTVLAQPRRTSAWPKKLRN